MPPIKILIIEDDEIVAILLQYILAAMGYDVCGIEATERGAIEAADRYAPDLLIVDVKLRSGNGISAAQQIRDAMPIPCLFIGAGQIEAFPHGAEFLRKPFGENQLRRAIEQVMPVEVEN